MELCKRWTAQMKNNIGGGGVMAPVIDPCDPSAFYVSDGWGSYYGSMRLRKLSLETGEELASVLTRDSTRCICVEEDRLFAVLNKRVLELNRSDLSLRKSYKKGVPQYSDCVGLSGTDQLLLMNRMGSFLSVFDLKSETVRKKKVDACRGIWRETESSFLLLNGDAILRCHPAGNKLEKLADTPPCLMGRPGPSGRLYLLCRGPGEAGDAASKIVVYSAGAGEVLREIVLEEPVQAFALSLDESKLFLTRDNRVRLYSIPEEKVVFQQEFEGEFALEDGIYVFHNTFFTYQWREKKLTCWQLNGAVDKRPDTPL